MQIAHGISPDPHRRNIRVEDEEEDRATGFVLTLIPKCRHLKREQNNIDALIQESHVTPLEHRTLKRDWIGQSSSFESQRQS